MDSSAHAASTALGFQSTVVQSYAKRWIGYVVDAPKATKAFALIILGFYLATHLIMSGGSRPYPVADILGLIPGYTFSSLYIWNIVTAGFYHAYFIDMVLSLITLLVVGKYLEPFWGTKEFTKFVIMVNAWAGLGCVFWNVCAYLSSDSEAGVLLLFPTVPYGGFGGTISAFAVAGRQLIPEFESPIIFGLIPARVKHMPLLLLMSNGIWHLLGFPVSSYSFTFSGTLTAWIYLRYFQVRLDAVSSLPSPSHSTEGIVHGDRSEATSFIGFFPEVLHPVLNKIFFCCPVTLTPISNAMLSYSRQEQDSVNGLKSPSPVPVDLEVEKRRLQALQQVDARIAKMKASRTPTKAQEV